MHDAGVNQAVPNGPDSRDDQARLDRQVRSVVAEPLLRVNERPTASALRRTEALLEQISAANQDLVQELEQHFALTATDEGDSSEDLGMDNSDSTYFLVARATNQIALYEALGVAAAYIGWDSKAAAWRESSQALYGHLGPLGARMMINRVWALLDSSGPPTRLWAVAAAASLARSSLPLGRFHRGLLTHGAINHAASLGLDNLILSITDDDYVRSRSDPAIRVYLCLAPFRLILRDWSRTAIDECLTAADNIWSAQSETDFPTIRDEENVSLRTLGRGLLHLLTTNPRAGFSQRLALLDTLCSGQEGSYESVLHKPMAEQRSTESHGAAGNFLRGASKREGAQSDPRLDLPPLHRIGTALLDGLRAGAFDTQLSALTALRSLSRLMASPDIQMSTDGLREFYRQLACEFVVHHANLRTPEGNIVAFVALESIMNCGVKAALLRRNSDSTGVALPDGPVARYYLLDEASSWMDIEEDLLSALRSDEGVIICAAMRFESQSSIVLRAWIRRSPTQDGYILDAAPLLIHGRNNEVMLTLLADSEQRRAALPDHDIGRLGRVLFPYEIEQDVENWLVIADEQLRRLPWNAMAAFRLPAPALQAVRCGLSVSSQRLFSDASRELPHRINIAAYFDDTLAFTGMERDSIEQNGCLKLWEAKSYGDIEKLLKTGSIDMLLISGYGTRGDGINQQRTEIGGDAIGAERLLGLKLPAIVVLGTCHAGDSATTQLDFDLITGCFWRGVSSVIATTGAVDDRIAGTILAGFFLSLRSPDRNARDALRSAYGIAAGLGLPGQEWNVKYFGA